MTAYRKAVPHAVNVRLALAGTRVIVLPLGDPRVAGVITDVRTQVGLRPYVVTCDNGLVRYASGYDLALESDLAHVPLAPRSEF